MNYKKAYLKQKELIERIKLFWDISKIGSIKQCESELAALEAEEEVKSAEDYSFEVGV